MQTRKSPISRQERLKRRVDISRVFKRGRAVSCPGIKLFFLANDLPNNRIAISFVRKYGNAVLRNRMRRLGREAYRLIKDDLETGFDLVLLLYPARGADTGTKQKSRGSLAESSEQLKTLFWKAGMSCKKVQDKGVMKAK